MKLTQHQKNCIYNGTTQRIMDATNGRGYVSVARDARRLLEIMGIEPSHPEYHIYRIAAVDVILERDYPKDAEL